MERRGVAGERRQLNDAEKIAGRITHQDTEAAADGTTRAVGFDEETRLERRQVVENKRLASPTHFLELDARGARVGGLLLATVYASRGRRQARNLIRRVTA